MDISIVDRSKADQIAKLVVCLLDEIMERTGNQHFDLDLPFAADLCEKYIRNGQYHVMAVYDQNKIIGFAALCESHSINAKGAYGIIQELYIMPEYRSQNIGKDLIVKIVAFAKSKQWKRLELCTPPIPEFDRTVKFYQTNGFEITGGYKMKLPID